MKKVTSPNAGVTAEYIWVDGTEPTRKLRCKTRILPKDATEIPVWGFDGSSTNQATGKDSDCLLEPVFVCHDPIRGHGSLLVLCEVFDADGKPQASNTRAALRRTAQKYKNHEPWFGIEQEYTMFKGSRPLAWPESGVPMQQGPYYCGVGADEVFGRPIVEAHREACLKAGLMISGINAEVMPGQWEFQIGPTGPLEVSDHLLIARWLLYRIGEDYGVSMKLAPKPVDGDWNGAGAHTNFSTKTMREEGGRKAIDAAIKRLRKHHKKHIKNYGDGIERRLTGKHETCDYRTFSAGPRDRGASIRIPLLVEQEGCGYLEDRRPNANVDPYVVTRLLLETVCG